MLRKAGFPMYARVTTGQVDSDQLDTFLDQTRATAISRAKTLPGYVGAFMLADQESGKFIGISLWETEAIRQSLEDSGEAAAGRSRTGSLLNVIWNDPQYYEVRIAEGTFQEVNPSST